MCRPSARSTTKLEGAAAACLLGVRLDESDQACSWHHLIHRFQALTLVCAFVGLRLGQAEFLHGGEYGRRRSTQARLAWIRADLL